MTKRIFLCISVVFSMLFTGCSETSKQSNSIELTEENYQEYLVLYSDYSGAGTAYDAEQKETAYSKYAIRYSIDSASSNYQFYDTTLELEIGVQYYPARDHGAYKPYYGIAAGTYAKTKTETVKITLDNEGHAEGSCEINLSPDVAINDQFLEITYELKSITGSVSSMLDE